MTQRRIGTSSLTRLLGHWHQQAIRTPVYRQLADGLRLLILDGRLPLDSRLPGERELSAGLGVSRTTVASALAQLREEGYLQSRQGSGSVTMLPEANPAVSPLPGNAPVLDLSTAALSAGPEIHKAYSSALISLPEHLASTGYDSQGLPELREAIARHYQARGLPTQAEQIMVVNGAVSALGLVLRLLTGPGDRVVVDHPTYPMALAAIRGASCRPVPVSLPATGWDVDGLAATIAQTSPRLAYLIPDFHNPTGRCMDADTRQRVSDIAARSHTMLVVDETMADLWFDAPPPPPLAAFGNEEHTISLGSAGKSFWGGLRLGWIRASTKTIGSLIQVRNTFDLGTPLLEQLAAVHLFNDSESFLPQRRELLRQRCEASFAAMRELFPDWQTSQPEGGLSWWVELPRALATVFAAAAESQGIRIGAGPRFGVDGAFERYLRLPFSLEPDEMRMAMQRLQPLWQHLVTTRVDSFRGIVL
ncbi:PLP-dependent aminotransferase family protein [Cedecea davisae]|uniref:PLP-dependent aminotransferase family protein n=1 Tax=Cedecea davisae TaxID=158484 RepID=A0ABS6DMW2_9ENTR|nr:PLP-dependent aminotransferase family protein [Cedecea davisae]MBU4684564.1 PLP-dependent aminotransferase family protein [Cedecea davisae]MBU4688590.1 PLP-dependent aminotransferase family protein [Cedecea davisae]